MALVVLVALGAVALGRPGLGSSPGLSPTEAQASAPGHATLFDAPFDGLFVDASLPPPWTTTSTGSAQIVALPTSVDRSLRLRSDGSGTPVTVCRPILDVQPTSAIRVELDVMAESLPAATPSPVVTLRADGTDLASLGLDSKGALVDSGGQAASAIHAGAWYHLTLTLDRGAGTVTWQAVAADGSMIRPAAPSRAAGTSAVDAVCLLSPAGTRSGALVVNNLAVRE